MDEANTLLDLECSQVAGLTRTKTEFLLARHKALDGFIVMDINDGARHYIDAGAVRRLSCAEAYAFMKPESNPSHHDGAAPAPIVDGVVLPPDSENHSERK